MSMILTFAGTWGRWYRVLRYAKAFSLVASVRYGLWLARSSRECSRGTQARSSNDRRRVHRCNLPASQGVTT
jgi:hypothetical protein